MWSILIPKKDQPIMKCWKCGASFETTLGGKISFRAECEKCLAALHSCMACKFYKPGYSNDCMVPGTDFIADRTKMNLCEDFAPHGNHLSSVEHSKAKKRFEDLFKD
jgi:hypothetical protein